MADKGHFAVTFYKLEDGSSPVQQFLDSLDAKMRSKILRDIGILKEFGNGLREPISKHIEDGIFELRAQVASDISRVLYFFIVGREAVLTNGFVKKTRKTPRNEIELAKKRREDHLRRKDS